MVYTLHVYLESGLFYIYEAYIHIYILYMNIYMYLYVCILGCIYMSYLFLHFFVFGAGFVLVIH